MSNIVSSDARTNGRHACGPSLKRAPHWEVLENDHPDHLDCHRCKAYHHMDDALGRSTTKRWTKCGNDDSNLRMSKYIHPEFNSTIFRMIMKQSRQGKDVTNVVELLSYRGKAVYKKSQVSQKTSEPSIINGRLLMRSQKCYIVSPSKAVRTLLLKRNFFKCPHSDRLGSENIIATQLLASRFENIEEISIREHITSLQCNLCPTEFSIFLERFEGQGILLFVVKWQDIGTGLAPLDRDLRPIIGCRMPPVYVENNDLDKEIEYESPRDRFEQVNIAPGLKAAPASLTAKERLKLFTAYDTYQAKLLRCRGRINWAMRWPTAQWTYSFPHLQQDLLDYRYKRAQNSC